MKQRVLKESREFKKYWELCNENKLTAEFTDDLIKFYYKHEDSRNKCTAAIFLSHIDNDDRIPPILFDALKYWKNSGYNGWVVTSNGRLFNYYPEFRGQYLDKMFNGNDNERRILSSSLFFIQEKLRNINESELLKIKKNFICKEKKIELKKHILGHFNLHSAIEFAKNILVQRDPLNLIKNGAKRTVYEPVFYELIGFYNNEKQKRLKLERAILSFKRKFGKEPKRDVILKIIEEINNNLYKDV